MFRIMVESSFLLATEFGGCFVQILNLHFFKEVGQNSWIFRSLTFTAGVFGVVSATNLIVFTVFFDGRRSIWWTLRFASAQNFCRDGDLWGMEIPLVYNSIAECIGIVFFGHVCFHPFHCVLRFTLCLCFANFAAENNMFGTCSVFWFDLENDTFFRWNPCSLQQR